MNLPLETVISAQVILHSASGKKIKEDTLITAENIAQYQPSQEAVHRASRIFASLGFEADSMLGVSFSITAKASTFMKVFKVKLNKTDRGGIEWIDEDNKGRIQLPMKNLPKKLTRHIHTITFTPPPDFGPEDY